MRLVILLAIPVLAMAAGCTQPDAEDPGAARTSNPPSSTQGPEGSSTSWSSPSSSVVEPEWDWDGTWIAHTQECGLCSPDARPTMAAVDADGEAMLVTFRRGSSDPIQFSNGTGGWRPYVQPVFELLGNGSTNGVEVVRVQVRDIPADEWPVLAQDIRDGLATARDPQPKGGPFVADGGYERLWAEGRRVTLDHENYDGGGGWTDVADAMDTVRDGFSSQG